MKKIVLGLLVVMTLAVAPLSGISVAGAQMASYPYARSLTLGSDGADVIALQSTLVSKGYLVMPAGVAMGYFGSLTQSALARYQVAKGIAPAIGYFGPITRAAIMNDSTGIMPNPTPGCMPGAIYNTTTGKRCDGSTPPPTPIPNPIDSSEGRLIRVETTGGTDSSVEEGDVEAKVLAVRMEARDGDVTITRTDVDVDLGGAATAGGSSNLGQYIKTVSLWLDGKKLGSQNVSSGDKNGKVTTFRFSNLKGLIEEGDSARLYVAIDALTNIDDHETGKELEVSIPRNGIRVSTGNTISDTYPSSELANSFDFREHGTGKITLSSDQSENHTATVEVDDNRTTDDVTLLSFTLKAKDQKNTVDQLTVNLDAAGSASTSDIIDSVYLFANGKEVGNETVSRGATSVTFDDLDIDIAEGKTAKFEVRVDIKELENNFAQGDSLTATVGSDDIEAEDERGDVSDVSGTAEGGTITLRTEGVSLEAAAHTQSVDAHSNNIADDSTGEYTVTFRINAFGGNAFIPLTAVRASSTDPLSGGVYFTLEDSAGSEVSDGAESAVVSRVSGGSVVASSGISYLKVNDGQSATLKLTLSYDPDVNGFYRAHMQALNFKIGNASTPDKQERGTPEEDFQTDYVNIQ